MMSSNGGKLELKRHRSSGVDWAIAGLATAAAARPSPDVRISRRFISSSPARLQANKSTSAMAYPQGEIQVPGVAERGPDTQHFVVNTGLFGYAAAPTLNTWTPCSQSFGRRPRPGKGQRAWP